MTDARYGYSRIVNLSYEEALVKVTAALKERGFGVLTEIDVKATLKEKLGVESRPYKILGACNPSFAHKALQAEEGIGLLLPCNVIVYINGAGETVVSAIDPIVAMRVVDNPALAEVAEPVRERLVSAIDAV
ncbi:MAG: DUF302 domain-containing protein [Candidatus Bathyarchaeia archaeon]